MTAGRASLLVGLWPSSPGRIVTSSGLCLSAVHRQGFCYLPVCYGVYLCCRCGRGLAGATPPKWWSPSSQGAGFLQVWMWSGCCPVSCGLYFRKIFLCYIFIALCVFGRRFPLLYSRRHLGSRLILLYLNFDCL